MDKKDINYQTLLLPQHRDMLEKSRHGKLAIPIIFSFYDVAKLFRITAKDILSGTEANSQVLPLTEKHINRIDPKVRQNLLEDPAKTTSIVVMNSNVLLHAFAALGAAAAMERGIAYFAAERKENGEMVTKTWFSGQVDPNFMRLHQREPLVGARIFFSDISNRLKRPTRMAVQAVIAPTAQIN